MSLGFVLTLMLCLPPTSQCQRGASTVAPPQEHVDQSFIPERISRTEVCVFLFFFSSSFFSRDYIVKGPVTVAAFVPALDVLQIKKHEEKEEACIYFLKGSY